MFRGNLQFNSIPLQKRTLPIGGSSLIFRRLCQTATSIWFIFLLSLLVVILQRQENPVILELHQKLATLTTPLLTWTEKPLHIAKTVKLYFTSQKSLILENDFLKSQNQTLIRKNQEAVHFSVENKQLRQALNVSKDLSHFHTMGKVIGHKYNGACLSLVICASDLNRIEKDSVILSSTGILLGRVVHGNSGKTDVLSVTNMASRIPVKVENSSGHAILAGNSNGSLKLLYMENMPSLKVGMVLITSGFGGIFPPGIPVGKITEIQGDTVYAKPLVNAGDADHVLILT